MVKLTKDELVGMAIVAGFSAPDAGGMSGMSVDDELLYVDEYPVGEAVFKFAEMVRVKAQELSLDDINALLTTVAGQALMAGLALRGADNAFHEWAKGCSSASPGKPWECAACTEAYYNRMKTIVDARRTPLAPIDPEKKIGE